MRTLLPVAVRQVEGTLRRRLLINAVVDPDEAAARLPVGLRPHVTDVGTVVGCCLLDVVRLRPAGLPAVAGIGMRAAAHRISAEWDDELRADGRRRLRADPDDTMPAPRCWRAADCFRGCTTPLAWRFVSRRER